MWPRFSSELATSSRLLSFIPDTLSRNNKSLFLRMDLFKSFIDALQTQLRLKRFREILRGRYVLAADEK